MATKLRTPLRRELTIGGKPYMLTITPDGFKLVPKGKRKGRELRWRDLVSGEAALAVALNASLEASVASDRRRKGKTVAKPSSSDAFDRPTRKAAKRAERR